MATLTPTLTVKQPKSRHGGSGDIPRYPGGGGGGRERGDDSPDYGERLRRCRLGLAVGIAPIVMLFIAFSSAYIVRQGLASLITPNMIWLTPFCASALASPSMITTG